MGKAALGELQGGEAVLGPPWSPCRPADLLQCRQTCPPQHQANRARQGCTCCPFALMQEPILLNAYFLLAASMDFFKKYLFIYFLLSEEMWESKSTRLTAHNDLASAAGSSTARARLWACSEQYQSLGSPRSKNSFSLWHKLHPGPISHCHSLTLS